jgi:hypothetical protein
MEVSGKLHVLVASPLGMNPGIHRIRKWVGSRAGLGSFGKENLLPPLGFKPWTIQPVAGSYTNYPISGQA